jgi:membrane-associated phospholipid phosphatase
MRVVVQLLAADSDILRARSRLVWALIAAMATAAAAACWAAGLSITWQKFPTIPAAIAGCAAVALYYRFLRFEAAIVYATELITQIFLIIFLGEILTYGAAASGLPYRDAELFAADRWLGFDLQTYLGFVDARPWLALFSLVAYMTMLWQAPVVFVMLSLTGRVERLQDFAVALVVSLVITIAIFALFPALGWYGYLRITPGAFPHLSFFATFVSHLEDIRSGALRAIPIDDIRGIISFPSYHAAAAALAVWALWPIRVMRWPLLILNTAMVASTPIEGTHYFVDVIGGLAVSASSVLVVVLIRRGIHRRYAGAVHGRTDAKRAFGPVTANLT